jgi:hypothetical protein
MASMSAAETVRFLWLIQEWSATRLSDGDGFRGLVDLAIVVRRRLRLSAPIAASTTIGAGS